MQQFVYVCRSCILQLCKYRTYNLPKNKKMDTIIVRYKLKPGRAEENERLIKEVYGQLKTIKAQRFSYATYKLEDGQTFIHIARTEDNGISPLSELSTFKEFQRGIKDRCEELPVVSHSTEIGSYGVFINQNN